jgi:hypothetical protein
MSTTINCRKSIRKRWSSFLIGVLCIYNLHAQERNTQLRVYGHLQYNLENVDDINKSEELHSYFSIGEQDFFVTSVITDRITFLGESVIRYDNSTATKFAPSIERAQLKFDYTGNHSLIVGKMHTPVNYWNDVYHHGRLFFPTIDRPASFSYFIPLHSLGIRLQGQNLGRWNWGYDLCASNGIASTDIYDDAASKAVVAAIHCKPIEGLRAGVSYFNDYMPTNITGAHVGHGYVKKEYTGALNFELMCASLAYFGKRLELLYEGGYNLTATDSLGTAENQSHFGLIGWKLKEKYVPYALIDFMDISERDLHSVPFDVFKIGLGFRIDFNYQTSLKMQLERYEYSETHQEYSHTHNRFDFKVQLAYGF